ncbi:helicase IV [Oxobacter pfennigii]|uniref:Helicase IV n=1 Tax=Oxobacter pfennigii TaxID=36849 RepID=A0A0P8X0Y2_9CLOT|nr:UvrD-helicase domain-containing protein [Oxobacter pfennigii]KPU44447.1 helicase IV [Oxobacter pfennigii]
MFNPKETDERKYLDKVLEKLAAALEKIEQKITDYSGEILEIKRYMYENLSQLDSAEKAANRIAVNENINSGERAVTERTKLQKLIQSPYFGRIDFADGNDLKEQSFYIGVHGFSDSHAADNIIFDWRSPVSSMFYDFETGPAFYEAPIGKIEGTLVLKRQYRIRQSEMEYMIESSLNIGDEILQKELSQNSDDKMKNIVATIQREQNAIIRNEAAKVLIIQGAAGSGKTSIALHRVAFLLYRYKETLTSNNILIISPNKVFGSYISNVLPELGEENILEMSFEDITASMIGKKYKYQTFFQQVESLLDDESPEAIARIKFKSTNNFVEQLQSYLEYAGDKYFEPVNLDFGVLSVSKEDLLLRYYAYKRLPIKKRLEKIADDLIAKCRRDAKLARQIKGSILKLFKFSDAVLLYKNFYRHIKREDLFQFISKNTFEFCDVFPFVYTKMYFDGTGQDYKEIQHLLVDEMQDYTPVQYAVLAKLFSCKMTILGDSNQSVNPYSSSAVEKIQPYFAGCDFMELHKSYRSTIEITDFAQKIQENKKLIPIERHGDKPSITVCNTENEQFNKIQNVINQFKQSGYTSLGIICKSQKQADQLYKKAGAVYDDISLLDFNSNEFKEGIIISSVHMSKGLEFDQVIIPDASDDCYKTQLDRSLLYIACTRAMHKLDLTCYGKKTKFI